MADYTDLTTLKAWLGDTLTVDDSIYTAAITAASRAIDESCNRRFFADTSATARTYVARRSHLLIVHDISTTTGLVVAVDHDSDGTFETTLTLGIDFQVEPTYVTDRPYTMIRTFHHRFPLHWSGRAGVQVTAQWGWPGETPDPIVQATLILASRFVARKTSPAGVLGFGDLGNVVRVTSVDRDVQSLIAPYKRARTT